MIKKYRSGYHDAEAVMWLNNIAPHKLLQLNDLEKKEQEEVRVYCLAEMLWMKNSFFK